MHPSNTTGLDAAIYQIYAAPYHGPWNQLLHHYVHNSHRIYRSKQLPYDPHANYHYLNSNVPLHMRQTDLLSKISNAIDGEYSAIACYQKLKNLAPTKKEKTVINEIRKDEISHFNTFSNLYTQLTGKKHTPHISEHCPDDYSKGIDFAFNDEQQTVDMYLDIAYQTDNIKLRDEFLRAVHDEQTHAVWFLYFMK